MVGADRTAEELGRAFPNTVIRQSSGGGVLPEVPSTPALVVATPGAEPVADGGYAGAVLLDTDLLLLRADLRSSEEALRRWLAVVALVRSGADGGSVIAAGDSAARALQALVRLDPAGFAARELAERAEAHFPPAAKVVTVDGTASTLTDVVDLLRAPDPIEILGPVPLPGGDAGRDRGRDRAADAANPPGHRGGAGARGQGRDRGAQRQEERRGTPGPGRSRRRWASGTASPWPATLRPVRIVFAGTPQVALPSLEALLGSDHEVVAVLTRPDAPSGRGKKLTPSPVAARAAELGIETLTPAKPREPEFLARLAEIAPDCCPVVAYGALLPQNLLDLVPHGFVNLHFSLLPAWRGAAPVQHAVLAGDAVTGATTFRIVAALDAGPTFATVTEPIGATDTSGDLLRRLSVTGARLLVSTLDGIADGSLTAVEQPSEGITLAPKITVEDARMDWSRPADRDRPGRPRLRARAREPGRPSAVTGSRSTPRPRCPTRPARPGS